MRAEAALPLGWGRVRSRPVSGRRAATQPPHAAPLPQQPVALPMTRVNSKRAARRPGGGMQAGGGMQVGGGLAGRRAGAANDDDDDDEPVVLTREAHVAAIKQKLAQQAATAGGSDVGFGRAVG